MTDDTTGVENPSPDRHPQVFAPAMMSAASLIPVRKFKRHVSSIVRNNGRYELVIKPGRDDEWAYGKIPRLIIIYIQTLIARRDPQVDFETRTVSIDGSFSRFCRATGISKKSDRYDDVVSQIDRLARMAFILVRTEQSEDGKCRRQSEPFFFADYADVKFSRHGESRNVIRLSEQMWDVLVKNIVPVNFDILSRLGKSPRAIDVYLWLNYRNHSLCRNPGKGFIRVPWERARSQFDDPDVDLRRFRSRFKEALADVEKCWDGLHVEVDDESIILYRSKPSVPLRDRTGDDAAEPADDVEEPASDPVESLRKRLGDAAGDVPDDVLGSMIDAASARFGVTRHAAVDIVAKDFLSASDVRS